MNLVANEFRVKNGLIVSNGDITHEDGNLSYTSASELLEVTYLKANVIIEVENASSTDVLYKGMPVYVSAIGTGKPQVSKAEADDSTKMPSIGIVVADISASGSGYITTGGTLNGLDGDADATNPIVDVDVTTGDIGKVLYVSETAGVLTLTRPTAAASSVQNVGVITDVTGSAGSVNFKMKVSNIGRANDTPNKINIQGDIYTQGNVGIGTTSPTFTSGGGLHIKDSSQANVRLEENTGEYFDLSMLNGDAYIINRVSDGYLAFRTNSTDRMRILSDGQVGIGTTSPSFTSGGGLEIENATQANLRVTDSTSSQSSDFAQSENDLYIVNRTTNGDIKIRVNSSDELMTFDGQNQRVGIDTTTPVSKLQIAGDTTIYDGGAEAHLILRRNANGVNYGSAIKWQFGDSASSSSGHEYARITGNIQDATDGSEDGYLTLQTSRDGTLTEAIRINKDGQVGIGTTSPAHNLDVASSSTPSIFIRNTDPTHVADDKIGSLLFFNAEDSSGQTGSRVGAGLRFVATDQYGRGRLELTAGTSNPMSTYNDTEDYTDDSIARLSILTDGGNVGIGTTNPQGNLHIVGATGDAGRIYLSDVDNGTGTGDSLLISKSGSHSFIYNRDSGDLRLGSNDNSDYVSIDSTGSVGIGTTTPSGLLDVRTGSGFAINIGADVNTTSLTDSTRKFARIGLPHYTNAEEPVTILTADSESSYSRISIGGGTSSGNAPSQIFFYAESNTTTLSNGSARAAITSTGLGVGETSPTFPLHVKYTDNRTDPEGSGASSGAGAIGADAEGGGLYIENLSTTDGSWSGITFRTDTADARIAYQSVGTGLINEGQMSFFLDANDTGGDQLTLEEVLRLRGGGSGASQTFNSVDLPTNDARLRLGASQQLELKFDGSHTRITHDAATDSWMIFKNEDGAGFQFNIGTDKGVEINKDGNVELYYDNSKKIETTSAGATVTGTLTTTDLTVTGDLTVSGTTTTLNTQTVEVEDNIIQLNTTQGSPDTATANVSGIEIYRGDGVNAASFKFDDGNSDRWRLYNGTGSMDFYMTGAVSEMSAESNHLYLTTKRDQDSIYLRTGTTETTRLYIDGGQNYSGYVGIGTTTPGHNLEVNGSFAATTKSFDIKHPTKEGMRLHHGSLEGPEHGVYHRGVGTSNVVELPDYWTGLVDEDTITVQLTPRGSFQHLFVSKVEGNRVHVDSTGDGDLSFYYNIYGTRKDVGKMEVEY